MDSTAKRTPLTLISRRRRRKKIKYRATHSKPRLLVQDLFTRREQHGKFHRLVQELKFGHR